MSKVHTAFGLVIVSGHHLKIILRRVLTTSISTLNPGQCSSEAIWKQRGCRYNADPNNLHSLQLPGKFLYRHTIYTWDGVWSFGFYTITLDKVCRICSWAWTGKVISVTPEICGTTLRTISDKIVETKPSIFVDQKNPHPYPPHQSKLGCLLYFTCTGSSNGGPTLHGGSGDGKALFSPFWSR